MTTKWSLFFKRWEMSLIWTHSNLLKYDCTPSWNFHMIFLSDEMKVAVPNYPYVVILSCLLCNSCNKPLAILFSQSVSNAPIKLNECVSHTLFICSSHRGAEELEELFRPTVTGIDNMDFHCYQNILLYLLGYQWKCIYNVSFRMACHCSQKQLLKRNI